MEETEVLIVGAGPSGLVLGLSLAQYEVKSTILERELEIAEDPRGATIQGDGVRTAHMLGLGSSLPQIGQEMLDINFHPNNFKEEPFLKFDLMHDWNEQCLSSCILQAQPRFERALRDHIEKSEFCKLQVGCKVIGREELPDGAVVEYVTEGSSGEGHRTESIKAQWLVGADGKRGVVRKQFLEPVGITQQTGLYEYTGTWIAANLKIRLPTPETHPTFPLWSIGVSPQQLYDTFWPVGWHFCTHPTRATATGRFGPLAERWWRHEFAIEDWSDGMDAEWELWEHLTPMITREASLFPGLNQKAPVQFPKDCVEVLRCRPFTFTNKVATPTWYKNRTIIIGDAAHVFPPFGGQGIASGIRDAVALSWRLALLRRQKAASPFNAENVLSAWNRERREGLDHATRVTMTNGRLTNQRGFLAYAQIVIGKLIMSFPPLVRYITSLLFRDDLGYRGIRDGFFLHDQGGGGKISQVYLRKAGGVGEPFLSDKVLTRARPLFTCFAIDASPQEVVDLASVLDHCDVDPQIISSQSIVVLHRAQPGEASKSAEELQPYHLCSEKELASEGIVPFPGYDERSFMRRLGSSTRYAIVRPDCIIFSASATIGNFVECLGAMDRFLS